MGKDQDFILLQTYTTLPKQLVQFWVQLKVDT